ncbi:hypothetical protein HHK36_023454 [Tetracentron sinense]|uniref:Protodermal factor 1 n=1 Tax=Tetracentron sinense TaxID=13715 RepID=A0A835D5E9_TETSI|nr:hypothetical protein HHK36_023454 [Tetracentron sinense]
MECGRSKNVSLFMWVLLAGLLSQNLVIPVMSISFEDQKTYYTPDPHPGSSHKSPSHGTSPSHGSSGSYGHTTPSHGSGGSYNPTPSTPSHGSGGSYKPTPSTPSHGSGGSYNPTPSTPSHGSGGSYNPTPSHGSGGSYKPTPSTPSHGSGGSYNPTPSTGGGGGGYYHSPPSSGSSGSGGSGGGTPVVITPPSTPFVDPGTPNIPDISTPSTPTPLLPDPNAPPSFTGTCDYWKTHPEAIWGLLGWWGTVAGAFGMAGTPGFGTSLSLQQALWNTRTDGIGALYREGTASLLNSMVNKKFPFTTKQVKDGFSAALVSLKAAAAQAELFKLANEGRFKPKA